MRVQELLTPNHCDDCQGEPEVTPTYRFGDGSLELCPRHLAKRYAQMLEDRSPSHRRFIGGTIYCAAANARVELGPEHPYGAAFTCPECQAEVPARSGYVPDKQKTK